MFHNDPFMMFKVKLKFWFIDHRLWQLYCLWNDPVQPHSSALIAKLFKFYVGVDVKSPFTNGAVHLLDVFE